MRSWVLLCLLVCSTAGLSQPVITSFSPASGYIGSSVTITGSNFNTTTGGNIVFFGAVKGVVTAASTTSLTVTVPLGATHSPIAVLNTATGLAATSRNALNVTSRYPKSQIQSVDFSRQGYLQIYNSIYSAYTYPRGVAVGDLDGDGRIDMVGTDSYSGIKVFQNTSVLNPPLTSANFLTIGVDLAAPAQNNENPLLVDMDNDGKLDIVVLNVTGPGSISVFRNIHSSGNLTAASFAARVDIPTLQFYPASLSIADIDNDGKYDLVVGSQDANSRYVTIFKNNATPGNLSAASFSQKVSVTLSSMPAAVATADMDGDGKIDIITANPNGRTISILRNTGTPGTLNAAAFSEVDIPSIGAVSALAIGDIDNDGRPDIAASSANDFFGIRLFRNMSSSGSITSGSFTSAGLLSSTKNFTSLLITDMNGDDLPDLLATSMGASANLTVFADRLPYSLAAGNFSSETSFSTGSSLSAAVGDFDGDSIPDVAFTEYNTYGVAVIKYAPMPTLTTVTIKSSGVIANSAGIGDTVAVKFTAQIPIQTPVVSIAGNAAAITTTGSNNWVASYVMRTTDAEGNVPFTITFQGLGGTAGTPVTLSTDGSHITFSKTSPSVVSSNRYYPAVATTKSSQLIYKVLFSKAVTGVTVAAFQLTRTSGSASGIVSRVDPIEPNSYIVTVSSITGTGNLRLDVPGTGVADAGGAPVTGFYGGQEYIIDQSLVTTLDNVMIASNNIYSNKAKAGNTVKVSFTSSYDILPPTITIAGQPAAVTNVNGSWRGVYTMQSGDADGPVPFNISFTDVSGVAGVSVFSTTDGSQVLFDKTAPVVTSISRKTPAAAQTNVRSLTYRVSFSENVVGIAAASFQLTTTGTVTATILAPVTSGTAIDLALTNISGEGQLKIIVLAAGNTIVDSAGNKITDFLTGDIYVIDRTTQPPTLVSPDSGTVVVTNANISGTIPEAFLPGSAKIVFSNGAITRTQLLSDALVSPFSFTMDVTNPAGSPNIAAGQPIDKGVYTMTLTYQDAVGNPAASISRNNITIKILDAPLISAVSSAKVLSSAATLNARVDDNASTTAVSFIYSTDPLFPAVNSVTAVAYPASITALTGDTAVTTGIQGLLPGTRYYYRVKAVNTVGTTTSATMSFTTGFVAPTITSFAPASGTIGTTVTIYGTHFNPVVSGNAVYFGGTPAQVLGAAETQLTVRTPATVDYQQLTVLNLLSGLSVTATDGFTTTFSPVGGMNTAAFANGTTLAHYYYSAIASGDFDGDGKNDIAYAYPSTFPSGLNGFSNFAINICRNTTSLSNPSNISFANPSLHIATADVNDIFVTDVDGDGKPDIIVSTAFSQSVYFYRNSSTPGNISFQLAKTVVLPLYTLYARISLGDLDNDGRPDLVAVQNRDSVYVYKNRSVAGTIDFGDATTLTGTGGAYNVRIGDIDGDGKADIITVNSNLPKVSVFRNIGNVGVLNKNSFDTRVDFAGSMQVDNNMFLRDMDGDHKPELVTVYAGQIYIMRNLSTPGIINSSSLLANPVIRVDNSISADIADVDGDGKPDIIYSAFYPAHFRIYKNNSTVASGVSGLSFNLSEIGYPAYNGMHADRLVVFDANNDGKPDIISGYGTDVSYGAGDLVVYPQLPLGTPSVVTAFSPATAATGTTINITGINFTGATAVSFGDVAATSFTVVSSTQIMAKVGNGNSGSVAVNTVAGSTGLGGFIYVPPPPTISAFSPNLAIAGTPITITGTNFIGVSAVRFGDVAAASFVVISSTQINAVAGSGSSGSVWVTTPGGTASMTGFSFIAPPTVTAFSPASAASGTSVDITGVNFNGTIAIRFGNVAARSFSVVSSTQIRAVVGNGASGSVRVSNEGGTDSLTGFTYIPPVVLTPAITSFSPTAARTGTTVVITGSNFSGTTEVKFGDSTATSFTVISPTQINATVGKGSSGNVRLTSANGTASLAGFTYLQPVPSIPVITSFTPTAARTGTTVVITGSNFSGTTEVKFGDSSATSFTVISPTQINAVVGKGSSGNVRLTSANGIASLAGFTYLQPVPSIPVITSFTPTAAGTGTTVVITGSNFSGTTEVKFGDSSATSFTVISPTQINAVVGKGSSGSLRVTNADGTASLAGFTYSQPVALTPVIIAFSPSSAVIGTTVLITGNNFSGTTAVRFGDVSAASFVVMSSTQISAVVGQGSSGSVWVTTPAGTASLVGFSFIPSPPAVTAGGPISFCQGQSVLLTSSDTANSSQWYKDGVLIQGATNRVYKVVSSGAYTIRVSNKTSVSDASKPVQVTVNPLPVIAKPSLTGYPVDTLVCFTSALVIKADNTYEKYLWSTGETGASITVTNSVPVYLKVGTNASACYAADSSVTVNARKNNTPVPVITRNGDALSSSTAPAYQWILNYKSIQGARAQTLPIAAKGIYQVNTSNDSVCWTSSAEYIVAFEPAVIARRTYDLIIYPNPSNGIFTIYVKFQNTTTAVVNVTIVSQTGIVKMDTKKILFSGTTLKIPVNITLSAGVYSLKVDINGEVNTQQIVIL